MGRIALERVNLMLEKGKLKQLRRAKGAHSNSQAVRIAIDHQLSVTTGINALRNLRALRAVSWPGPPENVSDDILERVWREERESR